MKKPQFEDDRNITVLVGGDVCPIGHNAPLFGAGDTRGLWGELLEDLTVADLCLVNLECPIADEESPITKCGPVLRAGSDCVRGLRESGIDVVNLANNHIMDHGWQGLQSTIRSCEQGRIAVVGAGENLDKASDIFVKEIRGMRIGVAAAAEHEFSVAEEGSPGANPIDVIRLVRMIRGCRDRLDFLIVLLHAGQQFYPYPTPRLQQLSRFLIDEGAHAVVCQHSHCPGSIESYGGAHIVYGQGNLIFDFGLNLPPAWYQGYLVRFSLSPSLPSEIEIVPYQQRRTLPGIVRMDSVEEQKFLAELRERSEEIKDPAVVLRRWRDFCIGRKSRYYSVLRGHGRILGYLNKRSGFGRVLYSKEAVATLLNYIQCETHLEALATVLSHEYQRVSSEESRPPGVKR
jgi:poly-gamma-glutamate capsule biosynthesis protein CapA/YwtB (metallophosphatase superfamily)